MYILCDQEISEIIEAVDLDGDGQINFEEYQELNAMMNYRLYQAMRTLMDQRFVKFQNLNAHYVFLISNQSFIVTFERIYCFQMPLGSMVCEIDCFNARTTDNQ